MKKGIARPGIIVFVSLIRVHGTLKNVEKGLKLL